jgi:transposase
MPRTLAAIGFWRRRFRGFVVSPKRRIVERAIEWLNRCRRLAKHREHLDRMGLAFLRRAMKIVNAGGFDSPQRRSVPRP